MALKLESRMLWIRVLQLILGLICFALYKEYGYMPCTFTSGLELALAKCRIPAEIATAAVVSFPLIITPSFIIVHLKYGKKFDVNIINPLLSFVGFILFIVAGSVELNLMSGYFASKALTALGAMCIVTGLVFLGDVLYWTLLKKDLGD